VIPVREMISEAENKQISEAEIKHVASNLSLALTNSTSYSSDTESSTTPVCPDHPGCDNWGPAVWAAREGLDNIMVANEVRHVAPGYDMVTLLEELVEVGTEHDPVFVVDLSTVMSQLTNWKKLMPRIQPFYAIKCNSDNAITRMLSDSGCGFDCASKSEIQEALSYGCPPDLIIYANPCKQASMLRYARTVGVKKMTADNVEELHKIKDVFPEAHVLLRIAVDDSKSVCRFNSKFGAPRQEWEALLETAREVGIQVVGFSFHVGSGCGDLKPFADAVASAREAFDLAVTYGFNPTLLDVGGGYPGHDDDISFSDLAAVLTEAVDHYFPVEEGVMVIAEPGRYMVSASHTYAVAVIAKRQLCEAQMADTAEIESFGARASKDTGEEAGNEDQFKKAEAAGDSSTPEVALYINDGVYGSFNCVVFDHAVVVPKVFKSSAPQVIPTKLFGPTCDSIDVVLPCTRLPPLNVGEWIYFENMGAYTRCAASKFNGQGNYTIHYVWSGMPQ